MWTEWSVAEYQSLPERKSYQYSAGLPGQMTTIDVLRPCSWMQPSDLIWANLLEVKAGLESVFARRTPLRWQKRIGAEIGGRLVV